jgi:hypothetical protein
MPYTQIMASLGRMECIKCGSHTYGSRCGTCESTALVPVAILNRNAGEIAAGPEPKTSLLL